MSGSLLGQAGGPQSLLLGHIGITANRSRSPLTVSNCSPPSTSHSFPPKSPCVTGKETRLQQSCVLSTSLRLGFPLTLGLTYTVMSCGGACRGELGSVLAGGESRNSALVEKILFSHTDMPPKVPTLIKSLSAVALNHKSLFWKQKTDLAPATELCSQCGWRMQLGITLQRCCFLLGTRTALGLVAAMLLPSSLEENLVTLSNHECCEGKRCEGS